MPRKVIEEIFSYFIPWKNQEIVYGNASQTFLAKGIKNGWKDFFSSPGSSSSAFAPNERTVENANSEKAS